MRAGMRDKSEAGTGVREEKEYGLCESEVESRGREEREYWLYETGREWSDGGEGVLVKRE